MQKLIGIRYVVGTFLALASLSTSRLAAIDIVVSPGGKIQDAIDNAVDGTDNVVVQAGTYKEPIDFKGKHLRVSSANGPETTIIDATGIANTAVVTFKTAEAATSVLEGFTLTGGTGGPATTTIRGGGGIFIDKAHPTVRNCIIKGNKSGRGGGVLVQGIGGGIEMIDCTITENSCTASSGLAGSGIAIQFAGTNPDTALLKNCVVTKNSCPGATAQGGGAYLGGTNAKAKVVVTSCTFNENYLGTKPAAVINPQGEGGGLFLDTILVEMEGGEVSGNTAINGGGIVVRNQPAASFLKNVRILGNKASTGGGGLSSPAGSSRLVISGCEIRDNVAGTGGGGGMLVTGGNPAIEYTSFIGNSSSDDGGAVRYFGTGVKSVWNAVRFQGNLAGGQGGAVYVSSTATAIATYTNCIFQKNVASAGGGAIYNKAPAAYQQKFFYCVFLENSTTTGIGGYQSEPTTTPTVIQNSILWGNKPTDIGADQSAKISFSTTQLPATWPATSKGMLNKDPQFENPAADPPDLRLKSTSELIDAGIIPIDAEGKLVATDFKGDVRVADGNADSVETPDIGAYELVLGPVIRPTFARGFCRGASANLEDARIDVGDAIYLLRWKFGGFFSEPGCLKGCDVDDSGTVELTDAVYLLNYLFKGAAAPKAPFGAKGEDPSPDALTCKSGLPQ